MNHRVLQFFLAGSLLGAASAVFSQAYPPYAPGWGYPDPSSAPAPFPGPGYARPGWGEQGPSFDRPPARQPVVMHLSRSADAENYYIDVELSGLEPKDIKVWTEGRWVIFGRDRSTQQTDETTYDEGRGYARSFSYSTGNTSRRLTLPRDAEVSGLRRDDSEGTIRITIPRRTR